MYADHLVLGAATTYGLAALATLIVTQVVIATAAAGRAGHTPGVVIAEGPSSFAFRAQRAHQNTLENVVPFALALAAAVAAGGTSYLIDGAVLGFVAARVAHASAYYVGVRVPRTAAFAVGLVAILALVVATLSR